MEILVQKYTDKSYKISGKEGTKSLKEELKKKRARFNMFLAGGPGWIVGLKSWEKMKEWLQTLSDEYSVKFPDENERNLRDVVNEKKEKEEKEKKEKEEKEKKEKEEKGKKEKE